MGYVLRDGENYFLFLALVTHKHFDLEIVSFPNQDENLGKKKVTKQTFFFFLFPTAKSNSKKIKTIFGVLLVLACCLRFFKVCELPGIQKSGMVRLSDAICWEP